MIFGHFYDHLSLPYFLPLTIHTAANILELSQKYNVKIQFIFFHFVKITKIHFLFQNELAIQTF